MAFESGQNDHESKLNHDSRTKKTHLVPTNRITMQIPMVDIETCYHVTRNAATTFTYESLPYSSLGFSDIRQIGNLLLLLYYLIMR